MSSFLGAALGGLGGGAIGRAVVDLVLDSQQYQTQLGEAEAKTKTSTTGMAGGMSAFSGVAVAASAVAAAAIVDFAKNSVEAYIGLENANLKLSNSVQNSTKVGAESIPVFQQQATAVSELTGVHNDLIISGQSVLTQMGLTADQITQLTPLVVDLAAKNNIDLNSAFKAVGKAALGSTGALARYVGPVIKGKNESETFANVLKKLGANAGFAADQAKLEPWKLLGNQMHLLSEQVGSELVPALVKVVPVIIDIVKGLGYGVGAVADFADGIDNFGKVIPPANAKMSDFIGAIDAATQSQHKNKAIMDAYAASIRGLTALYSSGQIDQVTYTNDLRALQDEEGRALGGTVPYSKAVGAVATQHKNAAAAARDQRAAEQALTDSTFGYIDSLKTLRTDQEKVNQLKKQGKQGTQEFADAVLAEIEAQRSYADAIKALAGDMKKAGDSTQFIHDKVFQLGHQAGLTTPDIQRLFDSLNKGAGTAHDNFTSLNDGLNTFRHNAQRGVTIPVHVELSAIIKAGALTPAQLQELALALRNRLVDSSRSNAGRTGLAATTSALTRNSP